MRDAAARLAYCLLLLATAAGHGVQPLSRIAIHRARVALDASAAVWASPALLGSQVDANPQFPSVLLPRLYSQGEEK
jgi:hypothetical protein